MAATVPLRMPRPGVLIGRALRLRCPRCGAGRLYASGFRMHERCPSCELRYEREQGYFVGAIYVNYALTAAVGLGGILLLDGLFGLTLAQQIGLAVPVMLLAPVAFFRHSRSLWIALGYVADTLDGRAGREPASRPPRR